MNAEPLIPLPKVRVNEALGPDQLITLWLIWACGITLGTLMFLLELTSLVKVRHVRINARQMLLKLDIKAKMVHLAEKILGHATQRNMVI